MKQYMYLIMLHSDYATIDKGKSNEQQPVTITSSNTPPLPPLPPLRPPPPPLPLATGNTSPTKYSFAVSSSLFFTSVRIPTILQIFLLFLL